MKKASVVHVAIYALIVCLFAVVVAQEQKLITCAMCSKPCDVNSMVQVRLKDADPMNTCSIRCAVMLAGKLKADGKNLEGLVARDFDSKEKFDASEGYYFEPADGKPNQVIAFKDKKKAKAWAATHKGELLSFQEIQRSCSPQALGPGKRHGEQHGKQIKQAHGCGTVQKDGFEMLFVFHRTMCTMHHALLEKKMDTFKAELGELHKKAHNMAVSDAPRSLDDKGKEKFIQMAKELEKKIVTLKSNLDDKSYEQIEQDFYQVHKQYRAMVAEFK